MSTTTSRFTSIALGVLAAAMLSAPEQMADELIAGGAANNFLQMAPGLARKQLLVLSSDDGLAPNTDKLAAAVTAAGGKHMTKLHVPTDHSWSDKRVFLQAQVIRWLQGLLKS